MSRRSSLTVGRVIGSGIRGIGSASASSERQGPAKTRLASVTRGLPPNRLRPALPKSEQAYILWGVVSSERDLLPPRRLPLPR